MLCNIMVIMANNSNNKCSNNKKSAGSTTISSTNTNTSSTTSPIRVGLYDIGDVIGEGNFATVRFARHRHTKSDVSNVNYYYYHRSRPVSDYNYYL